MKKKFALSVFILTVFSTLYSAVNIHEPAYPALIYLAGVEIKNVSAAKFNYFFIYGELTKKQYIQVSMNNAFTQIVLTKHLETDTLTIVDITELPQGLQHFWRIMEASVMISAMVGTFFTP